MFQIESARNGRVLYVGTYSECMDYLTKHWQWVLHLRMVRTSDGAILA